ncbi:MAG: hypothetical protein WC417_06340, partial [Candidatus Omnitrophota bacterium]
DPKNIFHLFLDSEGTHYELFQILAVVPEDLLADIFNYCLQGQVIENDPDISSFDLRDVRRYASITWCLLAAVKPDFSRYLTDETVGLILVEAWKESFLNFRYEKTRRSLESIGVERLAGILSKIENQQVVQWFQQKFPELFVNTKSSSPASSPVDNETEHILNMLRSNPYAAIVRNPEKVLTVMHHYDKSIRMRLWGLLEKEAFSVTCEINLAGTFRIWQEIVRLILKPDIESDEIRAIFLIMAKAVNFDMSGPEPFFAFVMLVEVLIYAPEPLRGELINLLEENNLVLREFAWPGFSLRQILFQIIPGYRDDGPDYEAVDQATRTIIDFLHNRISKNPVLELFDQGRGRFIDYETKRIRWVIRMLQNPLQDVMDRVYSDIKQSEEYKLLHLLVMRWLRTLFWFGRELRFHHPNEILDINRKLERRIGLLGMFYQGHLTGSVDSTGRAIVTRPYLLPMLKSQSNRLTRFFLEDSLLTTLENDPFSINQVREHLTEQYALKVRRLDTGDILSAQEAIGGLVSGQLRLSSIVDENGIKYPDKRCRLLHNKLLFNTEVQVVKNISYFLQPLASSGSSSPVGACVAGRLAVSRTAASSIKNNRIFSDFLNPSNRDFFAHFEGPVYYPASELDLDSILLLAKLFPRLRKLAYVDVLDPDEMNLETIFKPGEDDGLEVNIGYRYYSSGDMPLLQRQMQRKIAQFKYRKKAIVDQNNTSVGIISAEKMALELKIAFKENIKKASWMNGRVINISFLVQNIFKYNKKFDVIYVNYPGYCGTLAREERFWKAMYKQISSRGYLLETNAHLKTDEIKAFKNKFFIRLAKISTMNEYRSVGIAILQPLSRNSKRNRSASSPVATYSNAGLESVVGANVATRGESRNMGWQLNQEPMAQGHSVRLNPGSVSRLALPAWRRASSSPVGNDKIERSRLSTEPFPFPVRDFSEVIFPGIKIFDFGSGHPDDRKL